MSNDISLIGGSQDTTMAPVRLHVRYGWFRVHRADIARIVQHCQPGKSASVICTWLALLDMANQRKAESFDVGVGVLCSISGLSRRTIFDTFKVLENLGLLSRRKNPSQAGKFFDETTYSVKPVGNNRTTPQRNNRTTPSASKVPHPSHIVLINPPKGGIEKELTSAPPLSRAEGAVSGAQKAPDGWQGVL